MEKVFNAGIICLFTLLIAGFTNAKCQETFNKATYYKVMKNGSSEDVDGQLRIIEAATGINKDAYAGALLMRKAGLIKGPSKKLNSFKSGHKKLEPAIEKDNQNPEWRFLRLMIQEQAPKIVNYRSDIKEDAVFLQNNFKKLTPEAQAAVLDYRKQSRTLQPLNF